FVSDRKIEVNSKNAKKFTGSRTARGKAFSRKNAIKHGMAANLFPCLGVANESEQEFQDLCDQLRQEHQPVGPSEEFESHRIAICMWKILRAWRYENAEINKAVLEKSRSFSASLRSSFRSFFLRVEKNREGNRNQR